MLRHTKFCDICKSWSLINLHDILVLCNFFKKQIWILRMKSLSWLRDILSFIFCVWKEILIWLYFIIVFILYYWFLLIHRSISTGSLWRFLKWYKRDTWRVSRWPYWSVENFNFWSAGLTCTWRDAWQISNARNLRSMGMWWKQWLMIRARRSTNCVHALSLWHF